MIYPLRRSPLVFLKMRYTCTTADILVTGRNCMCPVCIPNNPYFLSWCLVNCHQKGGKGKEKVPATSNYECYSKNTDVRSVYFSHINAFPYSCVRALRIICMQLPHTLPRMYAPPFDDQNYFASGIMLILP